MNSLISAVRNYWTDLLSAIQFLTRIPVPSHSYHVDSLSRSVKFFPLVGLLIGSGAALLHILLAPHLSRLISALVVLLYLVLITGCLHEDGLADAADGFGGGRDREHILLIMRDSRIGSYGAVALILSLTSRLLLISSLSTIHIAQYLIAAHVLCRWTTLPLSFYLPSARMQNADEIDGQGGRIARLTSRSTLVVGTIISFAIVALLLRKQALLPILTSTIVVLLSSAYYMRKIGGITGDCFGATNQIAEIAVYFCGAWAI